MNAFRTFLLVFIVGLHFVSSAYDHTLGHLDVWKGHQQQWTAHASRSKAHSELMKTLDKYDSSSSSSTSTARADEANRQFYDWYMAQREERYKPTAPNGFRIAENADGTLQLAWNGSSVYNSSVYWIFSLHTTVAELESSEVCGGTAYSAEWNLGNLEYGTRYHAYVQKFVRYAGETYKSPKAYYSFVRSDKSAPVFRSGLSASVDASGTIRLAWSHATDNVGLNGYCVQIANDSAFSDIILDGWLDYVATVSPEAKCAYLSPKDGAYYCKVMAVDSSENASVISASVSIPLDANDRTGPAAPVPRGGVSDGFAYARWSVPYDPSGVRGYRVQVATDDAFANLIDDSYLNVEDFGCRVGSARTACLRVRAQDTKGNWGLWSQTLAVANTIPPVKRLEGLQYGVGRAGLGWSGVSGATGYDVVVSAAKDFSSPLYSGSTTRRTCSFSIPGSGLYHARVRAAVGTQKGPWAAISFGVQAEVGVDVAKDVFDGAHALGWAVAASANGLLFKDGDGRVQVVRRQPNGTLVRSGAWDVSADAIAASDRWWAAGNLRNDGGRVMVQKWDDKGVRQVLKSPNQEPSGEFGATVALAGDWLFVGATGENGLRGRVYAYRLVEGVWQFRQMLEVPDGGCFGDAIAASGEWLFVGAPYVTDGQENCRGRCYVFRLASSGLWSRFQDIGARMGADCFGTSVAVDGATAAIGFPRDYTIGGANGGVEMLTFDGTSWKVSDYVQPALWGADEKGCGSLVALKGDWLAVGVRFMGDASFYDSTLAEECGSVVLFRRVGEEWQEFRRQYAPDARKGQCFGLSLALTHDALVVGAPGDGADETRKGAVYSFLLPNELPFYSRPDVRRISVTHSGSCVTVDCRSVLGEGFDACEVQIDDQGDFGSPWIFVGDGANAACRVCLHPGTYLMRIRGRRNGHWSGWSCKRFVSTVADAQLESPGLTSAVALPNLTFAATNWPYPVYLSKTAGGEPCTSFVKGNVGEIRLFCSVFNLGSSDVVGKFTTWHRIYDKGGTCVFSSCVTNDELKVWKGFYWSGNDFGMMDKLSYGRYRYVCTLDEEGWVEERDKSDNTWEIQFEVTVPVSLSTPSALEATVDEASSYVALTWAMSDRKTVSGREAADRYLVQRTTLADGIWEDLADVGKTSFLDCTAIPGVSYWYRVVALADGYRPAIYCSLASGAVTGRAALPDEREYLVVDISGGPSASRYPVAYLGKVPDGGWTGAHGSSNIVLRKISGNVLKGDLATYYAGVFEITQRQWELVMGNRPSWFRNETCYGLRPVESVKYDEVAADRNVDSFLSRLRQRTGLAFDLPTQDEWEYFCRAGTISDYNDGSNCTYPGEGGLPQLARYRTNSGYDHWDDYSQPWLMDATIGTSLIGQYRSNNWGLFDMHGNVREMCKGTVESGRYTVCVVRGGAWCDWADGCMSKDPYWPPTQVVDQDMFHTGFRIALTTSYGGHGYVIAYDGSGATSGVPASMFCQRGRVYRLPSGALSKKGSRFAGWACSKNGKRYDDGMLVFNLAEPGETVTMTAIWEGM